MNKNLVEEEWNGEIFLNGLLCHYDAPDKSPIPYTKHELSEMVIELRKQLDIAEKRMKALVEYRRRISPNINPYDLNTVKDYRKREKVKEE